MIRLLPIIFLADIILGFCLSTFSQNNYIQRLEASYIDSQVEIETLQDRKEYYKGILSYIENIKKLDVEIIDTEVTAYSPSSHITDNSPFQMASGRYATVRELWELKFIALSRDLIEEYGLEWGDKVYVEFELQDTMNKRITNSADIFMRNLELAKQFGRQERKIIILRKGG